MHRRENSEARNKNDDGYELPHLNFKKIFAQLSRRENPCRYFNANHCLVV